MAICDMYAPEYEPGQVLIEVKTAGDCGSDLHMWRGKHSLVSNQPLVLGHEFRDLIVEVGENVQ